MGPQDVLRTEAKWLLQVGGAGHTDQEGQNKENYPLTLMGCRGEQLLMSRLQSPAQKLHFLL